jgi:hypothetical protein
VTLQIIISLQKSLMITVLEFQAFEAMVLNTPTSDSGNGDNVYDQHHAQNVDVEQSKLVLRIREVAILSLNVSYSDRVSSLYSSRHML